MSADNEKNLRWHHGKVRREHRTQLLGHGASCIWLTGLSGSGKSTIARSVEEVLVARGVQAYVLDGDNLRMGLNSDLGFSAADRQENIRRVSEVARLLVDSGSIVLCAFISPYRADRRAARELLGTDFVEVFVKASLKTCEERDPKGLYVRARSGEIEQFTGVSSPYEEPAAPELVLDTAEETLGTCVDRLIDWLAQQQLIDKT